MPHKDENADDYQKQLGIWGQGNVDLSSELLFKMGHALGYAIDKEQIKNVLYVPKFLITSEQAKSALNELLIKAAIQQNNITDAPQEHSEEKDKEHV